MTTRNVNAEIPMHLLLDGYVCTWFLNGPRSTSGEPIPLDVEVKADNVRYDGPERRDPERQHRRETDGEIRINTKKLTSFIAFMLSVITLVGALGAFFGSRIATQRELDTVVDSLRTFRNETRAMHRDLDSDNRAARQERAMIPKLAKSECLDIAARGSRADASIVGLPCDSLLPGIFERRLDGAR